ncbi:MAG TPA: hypothetical protein VGK19_16565 [Capsulimonadaceae bacterium]|jgi:hypothetical protein
MTQLSVTETVDSLKARFPDTPFIALGQTVFWDEPVKAAWRMILDSLWPEAKMIAGVHDTDYFAKSTTLVASDDEFVLLPHNDGPTRGLWSAAGELSTLFGSEDVPTRATYESHGVPFAQLASAYPGGKKAFYEDKTEAWGWRGIVHTGSDSLVAHDVPLSKFGPVLLHELAWGFGAAVQSIAEADRDASASYCSQVVAWVTEYIEAHPSGNLTDLYKHLLPRFYEALLGQAPANFGTTNSLELFRFNSQTQALARFDVVDLFLGPATRETCISAYNHAVTGGGMYALDTFGEGALPFDVVVSGRGRGTLRVTPTGIAIEFTGGAREIATKSPIETRKALAALLEATFGNEVALVGKAVSLINMLAAEFIVLFHETASGYTPRTAAMNDAIRAAGIPLNLKPIVRIAYPTWDALATAKVATKVTLPPHLAACFQTSGEIAAAEFGSNWRDVVAIQKTNLMQINAARKPRAVLDMLSKRDATASCWSCMTADYERALTSLASNAAECADRKSRIDLLRQHIHLDTQARHLAEESKGEDFRAALRKLIDQRLIAAPTEVPALDDQIRLEESRRIKTFDVTINGCQDRIRSAKAEIRRLRAECRAIERSHLCIENRKTLSEITTQVDLARTDVIRAAYITREALPHTNARPSAWWLPTLDPTGNWFRAIVDGTEARLEVV